MALLFIKQKLFPSRGSQSQQSSAGEQILKVPSSQSLRQPLLGSIGEHPHDDLEAQNHSYDTFYRTPSEDSSSSGGSSGSSRSRINPRIISDAILGLSDGLTVPFALSAGLSALGDTKVVVLGGLAELAAGAISMGLGGYVGAKSEAESYQTTVRETKELIESSPVETEAIVRETFVAYGISDTAIAELNHSLHESPERLLQFLIAFHHKESEPDCNQAYISAITLALGYFIGGFIPLIPYFIASQVITALYCSIAVMGVTLLAFGYVKTCIVRGWAGSDNVIAGLKGGLQMVVVGGVAAGAAIALVGLIDHGGAH
ncbi:hypothetical protein DTO166G4_3229 [Paecilomyces variotii]|nr:hypothetical protein DTO164E3_7887 [Paecilomyces variotii]KAJ9194631.1 hypothetical protein DTO032I3_7246 [Paecilomyces variotii]KAJ9215151.1 hypothetical protein DTO166G4_3229 [Paecilomyces variotii]KAJ9230006.1 hypothetical protein DTO169E5_8645 [Paecilomyces variotii]KAJ9237616.1 hypothetical protein DTO166G5_3380 [Paecilomyces variotii]